MDTFDQSDADQVYNLQKVFILATAVPYFVLVWDWLANLPKEYSLIFRSSNGSGSGNNGGILSIKNAFIASRYTTLVWCTFVIVVLGSVGSHPGLCSWARYFPYGYSTTMLFAHFVMVLRMYSIYERKKKILIFLLLLTFLDYALQMSANHAATSIYLSSQNPNLSVCFIIPTNLLYSLVFISPTVFHHIILVMTLYKSILHIRTTREGGIKSIMQVVQRDQILFVLAICLINFSNMVLVFQGSSWPYRLINQLPAAAFTQIFLSKIIFNLKHVQKKLASASASPVITALALSPSSRRGEFKFGNGSTNGGGGSPNDLELGDDFKSSSYMNNSPDLNKQDKKSFFSSNDEGNNGKKNIFTLRFDPERRRMKSSTSSSTNYATGKPSPLNKDAFRIEQGKMDSYALSSYKLPSPRRLESEEVQSPYSSSYNDLERQTSPTSPAATPSAPPIHDNQGHQHSSIHADIELSPYSRIVKADDTRSERSTPKQGQESIPNLSAESDTIDGRPEIALSVKSNSEGKETLEAARRSFESSIRKSSSTIDDQQRSMDWEPPNVWGTSQSPRSSPIPFSERRLSNSVARNSLTIQRSRQQNAPSPIGHSSMTHRPSLDGDASSSNSVATITAASEMQNESTVPGPIRNRASACYASILSFDNEDNYEEEEDYEHEHEDEDRRQPLPVDVEEVIKMP